MNVVKTAIDGVFVFEPKVFGDERGYLFESFRQSWLEGVGIDVAFVQDNHSLSSKGILRGLHYQEEKPQGKLVRVSRGEIFDVAVDLRLDSPTYGRWEGVNLSGQNKRVMWIPPGFAHGFYVLSPEAEVLYKCTEYYAPEYERSIRWNDEQLGIAWPISPGDTPTLSKKDAEAASFKDLFGAAELGS